MRVIDPEIIMNILLRGFTVIQIVDHTEDSFFVNFRLKGQKEFGMHSTILKKEFLDLLYDSEKQQLLDDLIDTVEVETIQDEDGQRTKLQIAMKEGLLYTNANITDDELLKVLKVKK